MNNLAIHQALRLEQYPEEMAWLCFPDSVLPEGTTELLRLCTSKRLLQEFAEEHDLDSETLHQALLKQWVILLQSREVSPLFIFRKSHGPLRRFVSYFPMLQLWQVWA